MPDIKPYIKEFLTQFLNEQYIRGIKAIHTKQKALIFWNDNAINKPDKIDRKKYLNLNFLTFNPIILFF